MSPKVSVVIPTYNRPIFLQRAVRSVLAQTFTDWELIVVNDGSEVAYPPLPDDTRIRYEEHAVNKGPSATRNTGIIAARGEYVAFLDDDDEWLPTKLEKQVAVMDAAAPDVGLVYTWYYVVNTLTGADNLYSSDEAGWVYVKALGIRLGSIAPGSTLLVRRSALERVGGYDEAMWYFEDSEIVTRISRHYAVQYVPVGLVRYHKGHDSLSDLITARRLVHIRRSVEARLYYIGKHRAELLAHDKRAYGHLLSIASIDFFRIGEYRLCLVYLARSAWYSPVVLARGLRFMAKRCVYKLAGKELRE